MRQNLDWHWILIFSDNPVFIEESEPEPEPQDDDVIEEIHSDSQSLILADYDESFLSDYSEQDEKKEEEVENEVVNQGLYKLLLLVAAVVSMQTNWKHFISVESCGPRHAEWVSE